MRNLRRLSTGLARRDLRLAGSTSLLALGIGMGLALPTEAVAQSPSDVKEKMPNILLLIDTSGSMNADQNGGWADCDASGKSRWVILVETLTGTVNDLECNTSGGSTWRIRSNDCYPTANDDGQIMGALASNAYAWPYRNGGGKNKEAIGFRNGGQWCWYNKPGDWNQASDGVMDIFADKIRFGLMTFDSVETFWLVDEFPKDAPLFSANHNARTDIFGGTASGDYAQASYWFEGPGNNWLLGPPTGYPNNVFFPTPGALVGLPYGSCTPVSLLGNPGYNCAQSSVDVGAKNSRARPWHGRLLGFGDPEASVPDTISHNDMVQQAILGHSRYFGQSTPLAGMMRDAYDFILNDVSTDGVQIPHLHTTPPTLSKLGPQLDNYVFGSEAGCRSQHVLVVTDGEPMGDITDASMAQHARALYDDSFAIGGTDTAVNTYVIGVGLDSARWTSNQTTPIVQDCAELDAADLAAGGMCERSSVDPLQWRYADECGYNGTNPVTCSGVGAAGITDANRSAIRACCNILETAIEGRGPAPTTPARPYFPKTQAELKTFMGDLISSLAGGSLSRTVPVFAASSATAQAVVDNADSFEIRSSLIVPPGNGLWQGKLERIRWQCTGGTQAYTPNSPFGDDFASNLAVGAPNARRFFTVSVDSTEALPQGSVRPRRTSPSSPDPNGDDCLYGCGNNSVGDVYRLGGGDGDDPDQLVTLGSLKTSLDATGGIDAHDLLGLRGSDKNGCEAALNNGNNLGGGTTWRDRCAEGILEWYGGDPDPEGSSAPTRHPNPLGGIYRSSPIIVEPPKPIQEDELFSSERAASTDPDSFVTKYGARPTMLYAQTVDGQLHAFVVNANATTGPWGAPSNIPRVNTNANNELWTFIPPAALPALWPNFDIHARIGDGPIAVGDVALSVDPSDANKFLPWRTMTDLAEAKGEFRTIIVVSGGPSILGGFYYALDVTDPLHPRFLWQLSSAGREDDERRALFGEITPAAAITTLRLREPGRPGERMVPVAILSGGGIRSLPTGVRNRRIDPTTYWDGSNGHVPRNRIRDWSDAVAARSLTVVELYSGRIIMRMGGQHCASTGPGCPLPDLSDHPLDDAGNSILDPDVLLPNDGDVGFFDSPLTSPPMVYPAGASKVAARAYVGDADGTVWRVNLSDPNPKNWTARIAFDAYNHSGSDNTMDDARIQVGPSSVGKLGPVLASRGISGADVFAIKGQPITTAPIISLDENLQTTVSFATGDHEAFQLSNPNAINMLVTFVDYFDAAHAPNGRFEPYVNRKSPLAMGATDPFQGIEMAFLDGASVTGALNMFDGQLMFAYFLPRVGTACTFGKGGWCAAHYLNHTAQDVPDPVMDVNGSPGFELCNEFGGTEVVFGIQINQKPSCQEAPDNFGDPWLAGNYRAITTSSTGQYEIVMHTGQGGSTEDGAVTKSARKDLRTPKTQTFVQSWVNAIE